MRTKLLFLFAFLVLAGCSSQPPAQTAAPVASTIPTQAATLPPSTPTADGNGCTSVSTEPTSTPNSFAPTLNDADYVFGPADAPVTIIEYCDFQAPICRSMAAVMSNLSASHPGKIRLAFRPVPLTGQLDKSDLAVQAAVAAGDQGKFWEMYDALFVKSDQWDALTPAQFETWVTDQASGLGLDRNKFQAAMKSQETADRLKSMFNSARDFGLQAEIPCRVEHGLEPVGRFLAFHRRLEFVPVQSEARSLVRHPGLELRGCERIPLIALDEERVIHLPELALVPGRHGSLHR